jgi:DNA-binding beta-propeller fold protein YncE
MKNKKYIAIAAALAGGVFFFVALFVLVPIREAEAAGSIVNSFTNVDENDRTFLITGLTKKSEASGIKEYFITFSDRDIIYKIEVLEAIKKWDTLGRVTLPASFSRVRGIAYNDQANNLWVYAGHYEGEPPGPKILKVTTSGSVITSFQASEWHAGGGLAWDGTYVYVLDYAERRIFKYTAGGSLLDNWPKNAPDYASTDRIPYGIAADSNYLWVTSYGKYDRIIQMTKNASLTGSVINAPNTFHPHLTTITTDGNHLMYADDSTDTLYEITK